MAQHTKACIPDVQISTDMLTASMKLQLDEGGQEYTVSELKEFLADHKVKTGINEQTLQDMIEKNLYGEFVEVARGKEAVRGKDGYYVYYVSNPEEKGPTNIRDDDSVDYVQTKEFTIVEEGELLAEYVPATNGEYGFSVDSSMRTPQRGQNLPLLRGRGFRLEDGKYYAALRGKVEVTEKGFHVTNMLEIKADVDIEYGHVQFDGDVHIRGDVKSDMTVKATGNIEIEGHVGASHIEAGGSITIRNGVQGKFKALLKAGENVTCRFLENATVIAQGDITANIAMYCELQTNSRVIIEGGKGLVIGGSAQAVQGMELYEVGNVTEVATKLIVGVLPGMVKRHKELELLIKKVQEEVDLLERSAKVIDRMTQIKASEEIANRRMKIIQAKVIKSAELKKYQDEQTHNEVLLRNGENAAIIVQKAIFPGSRVEISGVGVNIKDEIRHTKFLLIEGSVRASLLH